MTGEWLTSQQRLAVATETRRAFNTQGFDPKADFDCSKVKAGPECDSLPSALVRLIHQVCYKPGAINADFYKSCTREVDPAEYVECLSIVAHVIAQDTFHMALGLIAPALPSLTTASKTAPLRRTSNPAAKVQIALVPTVAPADATGALLDMWTEKFLRHGVQPYHVQQALSLVPSEQAMFAQTFEALYMPQHLVGADPHWHRPGSIDRRQIELLATRTSRLNNCFY